MKQSILEYYADKDADSIQNSKFKSKDWTDWCDLIKDTKASKHLKLENGSMGQNMCYTAFVICKGIRTEQLKSAVHFYIQKSIVGDFVTFYGTLDTNIFYENDKIRHPQLIVLSPIGPFSDLFESAWNLMIKNYPNCRYVSYRTQTLVLAEPEFQNKSIYELLFGHGLKLETNVYGDRHYSPE